jgi:hypothetical protein
MSWEGRTFWSPPARRSLFLVSAGHELTLEGKIFMTTGSRTRVSALILASSVFLSAFQAAGSPETEFAGLVKAYLGMSHPADWEGIEKLPGIKWAAQPPTSLRNCLPNGDCYTRQGTTILAGRNLVVVATGARTMALNLLFRSASAPMGEPAVVAALKQAGMAAELARCPVRSGVGGTNWYRLKGASLAPGHLSIQPAAAGRPEGFMLSAGEELPALQPNQLASYTDQCEPGAERKPVSTLKPHELLAQTVVALLVPAASPPQYDWKALIALPAEITWDSAGPKKVDLSFKNDPNPMMQSGHTAYAGRKFSLMASGTAAQVKNIYLDETGTHPRGEHMLGVVYQKGIAVKLVRCGPIYTESTNNWYSLTSAKTRPAMIRQSIHYDGNQVTDSYEIRLDGSLPTRDPRDRNPGVNGCA